MQEQHPVLKGAEPFYFEGNNIGILVQHGFTGTTHSMYGLGKKLADAGFTVYGPRLKGHGTHYEDLEKTTYHDWIESSEKGYQLLKEKCDQIFVVGLSMGGTLALHHAHTHPEIKGIVLINAALFIDDMEQLSEQDEPRYLDAIGSDIKAPNVKELAYEKTPLKSIREIVKFMAVTKEKVGSISCPTLVLVSSEDHVVPPSNSDYIMEHIGAEDKRKVVLHNSYHVATLDNDKELIAEECEAFIRRLS